MESPDERREARLRALMNESIGALRTLADVDDPNRPLPNPELPLALGSVDSDGRVDYRLVEEVGRGQSARVYRAIVERMSDATHRREVAVKLFRAMTEPSHFDAVRAEALRADRARSPHVVRVFDVGLWEGRHPYVVQDFHDAVHLEAWEATNIVAGARLPSVETCVRMMVQVARGVAEAHAQDLVHRDIAPRNILVCKDGVVRITDFGCAGFGESATNETVVGTPGFMPPEQWRSGAQLKQSDIASLAGVLYWLLTGLLPYGATREEILASHAAPAIAHARRSIELTSSNAPPPVSRAVLAAMEPDLLARTTRVEDFIIALEGWLASLGPRRRSERRLVVLIGALLVMVLTTVYLQRHSSGDAPLPFDDRAAIAAWFDREPDDPAVEAINRDFQRWGLVNLDLTLPRTASPADAVELLRAHEARILAEPDVARRLGFCLAAAALAGQANRPEERDRWLARGADLLLDPAVTQSSAISVISRRLAWEGLHAWASLEALTKDGSISPADCMTPSEAGNWQSSLVYALVKIPVSDGSSERVPPIPQWHPAYAAVRDWVVKLQSAFPSLRDELPLIDGEPDGQPDSQPDGQPDGQPDAKPS